MEPKEDGNVLFLILIAVALFAALSYAVTSSSRSTGDKGTESAKAQAARLLNQAADMEAAYIRLQASGCQMDQIDFTTLWGNIYVHTYPEDKCNFFDRKLGGGVAPIIDGDKSVFGTYSNPNPGLTTSVINSMDVYGVGTTSPEALYMIYYIRPEVCQQINKMENISTADGNPPLEDTPYEGGWFNPIDLTPRNGVSSLTIGVGPSGTNELKGHLTGCFRAGRSGFDMGYHMYSVLQVH